MTKTKVIVSLTIAMAVASWSVVRPGPRASSAVTDSPTALVDDPFTEDNAVHRYATNQPRHWRQMLNRK